MSASSLFFAEAGTGPGVVCLHANASTSGQWRALMALLSPRFHVLAPDSHGAGKGPAWPTDHALGLCDEVALIEPVLDRAGTSPVLVGHSYGAAVALVAAAAALDAGNADTAAGHFIDFWMGEGAWQRTPEARRGAIADSVRHVRGWANALFGEPTPLSTFAGLDVQVLLMVGSASPASSRGVVRLLAQTLPQVQTRTFEGVGHMGPITHAAVVNDAIARFLNTLPQHEACAT